MGKIRSFGVELITRREFSANLHLSNIILRKETVLRGLLENNILMTSRNQ